MSYLNTIIQQVENEWLEILYDNVRTIYKQKNIPSHNEDHHLRVWKYSLKLIEELHKNGNKIEKKDLLNLIIAVFFHDTGMISTPGPDHGTTGKLLCEKWLEAQSLSDKADKEKILSAILLHDDKTYLFQSHLLGDGKLNLAGILGVCDDLDAFGYTGIYRYMEIYLLRGTSFEELGKQVLMNISNRYRNFQRQCAGFPSLINIHSSRYEITESFYRQYNDIQLMEKSSESNINSGPYTIVRYLHRQMQQGNYSIDKLCKEGIMHFNNALDKQFFKDLKEEWVNQKL